MSGKSPVTVSVMVKTRASQGLHDAATPRRGSKRPHPVTPSVDRDDVSIQDSETKRVKRSRHFVSPGEQLQDEVHDASVRGSLEPTPARTASQVDEHALVPQSAVNNLQVAKVTSRAWVNETREDRIEEYELIIRQLEHEKAELTADHKSLVCAVHSLGFGKYEPLDVCASIRTEFDTVRGEEHKITCFDLTDVERVPNRRLLRNQPGLIRELNEKIESLEESLANVEARLEDLQQEEDALLKESHTKDALILDREQQIDEVREELDSADRDIKAERKRNNNLTNEKNELFAQLEERNAHIESLDADKGVLADEIQSMKSDLDTASKRINALDAKLVSAREDYAACKQRIIDDYEERLGYMVEELNQEHRHTLIAERDISNQNAAFATLQGQYENVTTRYDNIESDLDAAKALLKKQDQQIKVSNKDLDTAQEENEALSDRVADLDQQAEELRERAKELGDVIEAERAERKELETKFNDVDEEANQLDEKVKALELEINKLRAEAFGDQQEIARLEADREGKQIELDAGVAARETLNETITTKSGLIDELQKRIEALEKATDDLEAAKDDEIQGKNALLDQKNSQIEELTDTVAQKVQELNETLEEKNRDNELLNEQLKSSQRQVTKLRSTVGVRDEDVKALRREVNVTVEQREDLKKQLLESHTMFEALKRAHDDLIVAGQQDAATLKHWAEQREVALQEVKRNSATMALTITNGHTVTKLEKGHVVRDSGFWGSDSVHAGADGEETDAEMALEA